jgi:hypothetical protein
MYPSAQELLQARLPEGAPCGNMRLASGVASLSALNSTKHMHAAQMLGATLASRTQYLQVTAES